MSFSTVFQSYQDDGRMIMKGCVQWNLVDFCAELTKTIYNYHQILLLSRILFIIDHFS